MASIKMVPESEATGEVESIYAEIRQQFGIDFVPNLYKVMAPNPGYLAANWTKVKPLRCRSWDWTMRPFSSSWPSSTCSPDSTS